MQQSTFPEKLLHLQAQGNILQKKTTDRRKEPREMENEQRKIIFLALSPHFLSFSFFFLQNATKPFSSVSQPQNQRKRGERKGKKRKEETNILQKKKYGGRGAVWRNQKTKQKKEGKPKVTRGIIYK